MVSLESRLGSPGGSVSQSGEQTFLCPFCAERKGSPDKGYHLYVNTRKEKYCCHRCGAGGSLAKLLKFLHVESVSYSDQDLFHLLTDVLYPPPVKSSVACDLPLDYLPIPAGSQAHRYLLSRGVSDEDIDYFRIGFSVTDLGSVPEQDIHMYCGKGRVILPDYTISEHLEYWAARSYVGHRAKYKNSRAKSVDQIFNVSKAASSGSGYLFICEGPLDAVVSNKYLDHSSVALYGKAYSEDKLLRLIEEFSGLYYVCLDPDAQSESDRWCNALSLRGKDVAQVILPQGEDPASLGPRILDYIDTARSYSTFFTF